MRNWIEVKKADMAAIIRATFPDYRGRKVKLCAAESVTIHMADLNWSGGSRYQYRGATLSGQSTGSLDKHNATAPWDKPVGSFDVPIPAGACVVEHVMFCGKDLGLRIYVNPVDLARYLPKPEAIERRA
jgi:hypothetical protein